MTTKRSWTFLGAALLVGVTSCAATETERDYLPPGFLYEGPMLNVVSPDAPGWVLLESNADGMQFGRWGAGGLETFVAQVAFFPLEPTEGDEELKALIERAAAEDMDPSRFVPIHTSFTTSSERDYPCVRMESLSEDRKAAGAKSSEPQLLEMHALYCRHPGQSESGFAAVYSRRGVGRHGPLKAEADAFIRGVTVP